MYIQASYADSLATTNIHSWKHKIPHYHLYLRNHSNIVGILETIGNLQGLGDYKLNLLAGEKLNFLRLVILLAQCETW